VKRQFAGGSDGTVATAPSAAAGELAFHSQITTSHGQSAGLHRTLVDTVPQALCVAR
jgi:hypothetical protein